MNTDNLNTLFNRLEGEFDDAKPRLDHQARFLNKLKSQNEKTETAKISKTKKWKPLLAIAASIVLCLGLFTLMPHNDSVKDLANVSPELSVTQNFFTTTIEKELVTLNNERTPETAILIDDALKQLNILEKEYDILKIDLNKSGDDKRVIYAMINNFQNRIDVLQNVLNNIEKVKTLNQNSNEKITI